MIRFNKTSILIFLDFIIGSLLLPFGIFLGKILKYLPIKENNNILIIKFLGAGNYIAIDKFIQKKNISILTSTANHNALKHINPNIKLFLINDKNIFFLTISFCEIIFKLFFSKHQQIINLESESKFAKFLCALLPSRKTTGITNTHKGIFDFLIYDYYIVNHPFLDKSKLLNLLFYQMPNKNKIIYDIIQTSIQENINHFKSMDRGKKILIAPSCSETDYLRRLNINDWEKVINLFKKNKIEAIEIMFPNSLDPQYSQFIQLKKKYPKLNIIETQYKDFILSVKNTDLLVCIDSQALHIGQQFNKQIICFYGPTSPFAINLGKKTMPIYQSLTCSPCTHKYFNVPCGGKAPCMKLNKIDLNSINKLLSS